jgi:hypothetical protein
MESSVRLAWVKPQLNEISFQDTEGKPTFMNSEMIAMGAMMMISAPS